ncbi:MAG: histidine phosphatase family protein [Bacteroidales bacterium]|nr:histidine phosphatase family protein [Bacteroidales bacterium]
MKKLYLIRHGKSNWDDDEISDFDRPLKNRGVKNAYEMVERLKNKDINPELILSSPANRALHTAVIFATQLNIDLSKLNICDYLYEFSTLDILKQITKINDKHESVMIFGHNPFITDLTNYLTGEFIENIPTAGIASIYFDLSSWQLITENSGTLDFFDYPKRNKSEL